MFSYPTGRIALRRERATVVLAALAAAVLGPVSALWFRPASNGCNSCARNLVAAWDDIDPVARVTRSRRRGRPAGNLELNVPARQLPPSTATAAYFVCAEALTNVAKHAGALRVTVDIVADPGGTMITVADDGSGGADPARGSGPDGLSDRVQVAGGTFTVESRRGAGTRLRGRPDGLLWALSLVLRD